MMDCAPLCQTTCSNLSINSPCPEVCVRGCGCPGSMVIDEDQERCVLPSKCHYASTLVQSWVYKKGWGKTGAGQYKKKYLRDREVTT